MVGTVGGSKWQRTADRAAAAATPVGREDFPIPREGN
jgi:hypothetical protein